MKENKVGKDIFIITILTTITIAVWIALDIYKALNKTEIPPTVKKQIEPLEPKLDTAILDQLEEKGFYDFTEIE